MNLFAHNERIDHIYIAQKNDNTSPIMNVDM